MNLRNSIALTGRPTVTYAKVSLALGGLNECAFLCQFIYWSERTNNPEGWVYKTSDEIRDEIGISYKSQLTARKKLKSLGLIEERHRWLEHQIDYRIVDDAVQKYLESIEPVQNSQQEFSNMPKRNSREVPTGSLETSQREFSTHPNGNSLYKEHRVPTEITNIEYKHTHPLPPKPTPAVPVSVPEEIEAELISEPTEATIKPPEKPLLLKRSTKAQLQPFQQQWFEEFWMVYPRRDDRKEAKETFARLVINQEIFDKTMEALNTELPEMLGNVKRYRKMASTWLNTEPWDNPRESSPPVRALATSGGQRFNGARLTRKEQASIEFDRRVMREYGGGR